MGMTPLLFAAAAHWVATWGAAPSPQSTAEAMQKAHLVFEQETVREIIHTSLGGDEVRVRFSNVMGREALKLADAHVGVSAGGSAVQAGTDRALTFGGLGTISVPMGAVVVSDPVKLAVPERGDLAISLYLEKATGAGIHYAAMAHSFVAKGDVAGAAVFPETAEKILPWAFLAGVDVTAKAGIGALVTFGDSITDGAHSTLDANKRWPDDLARRLGNHPKVAVVNAAIGGNRVLHDFAGGRAVFGISGLARFDRDVLAVPGVKEIIVLEGINDLGHPGAGAPLDQTVSAEDLIQAYRQLIARAHEAGLRIIGATMCPFEGAKGGYYTPEKDAVREKINAWIRTGGEWDGVIDFDKATRDPSHPGRFLPAFDSGDHLHPNDAGYQAMAESVDLSLLK